MDYILRYPLTETDLLFLESSSVEVEIINTHGLAALTEFNPNAGMFDSGWRDGVTNARIISNQDRAVFRHVNETDALMLLLKFGDRLKELTVGFKEIYNIAEAHNVSPTVIADTPQF